MSWRDAGEIVSERGVKIHAGMFELLQCLNAVLLLLFWRQCHNFR